MFGVLHDDVLEPLMHEIADLSRAYERVHRIQATVVPYSVPRFVVNNSSNLLYAIVVSLLSPSSSFGRTLASTSKSWDELIIYGFLYWMEQSTNIFNCSHYILPAYAACGCISAILARAKISSTQAFTFFATYSLTKVVVPRAVPSIF